METTEWACRSRPGRDRANRRRSRRRAPHPWRRRTARHRQMVAVQARRRVPAIRCNRCRRTEAPVPKARRRERERGCASSEFRKSLSNRVLGKEHTMSVYETFETYEQEQEYGELPAEMEMELAAELLEITNEQELEQFLGDIVKSVGSFVKGPVGQALGGVLKNVAKTALPAVGGALGTMIAPGIGTAIGSQLGSF